jgi:hypothetical protein
MQPDKGGTATVRRAYREDIDWLRAAFRIAGLTTAGLLAGSMAGIVTSQAPSDADRAALQLESYNAYNFQPLYRFGRCFAPSKELFDDACLAFVSGKTNALLWGDSLAAHYFHGISKTTEQKSLNILQATQMQCMPTLNAVQGNAPCRSLAAQMDAFLRDRKPDLVIMSADWLEYARPPRFDGMIADLRRTISQLNALGVPVILLGPVVQFRSRLPSMLMRAQLRAIDAPSGFRAAGYFRARPNDESSIAGAGEVFLRFGGRCDLSGAAMPAHDRRGHSAGVGSCAPHRGGVGVCDGQVDADARA